MCREWTKWSRLPLVVAGLTFVAPQLMAASNASATGVAACEQAALEAWSDAETWIWSKWCRYEIADLDDAFVTDPATFGDPADPAEVLALEGGFLRSVLTEGRFTQALGSRAIHLRGGRVIDHIDLSFLRIPRSLILENVDFRFGLVLADADIEGSLKLDGVTVGGVIELGQARLEGGLELLDVDATALGLHAADVLGSVVIDDSHFDGVLTMDAARIDGSLAVRRTCLAAVSAIAVDVRVDVVTDRLVADGCAGEGRQDQPPRCDLVGAEPGCLVFNAGAIGGELIVRTTELAGFSMLGGDTGGDVQVLGSVIAGSLVLDGSSVGGSLRIWQNSTIGTEGDLDDEYLLDLGSVSVGLNLVIDGATLNVSTDLANAAVASSFVLSTENAVTWADGTFMRLSGAGVRTIRDWPGDSIRKPSTTAEAGWPEVLMLEGFNYEAIDTESGFFERDSGWYKEWLESDKKFSRQPYDELARALRGVGREGDADSVAIWRRDVEGSRKSGPMKLLWWFWGVTVGYGFRPTRALIGIGVLILVGTAMAMKIRSDPARPTRVRLVRAFSFSLFRAVWIPGLPGVHHESIQKLSAPAKVKRYFVVHTALGVLATAIFATVVARVLPGL